jgi:hypothetical protein
MFSPRVPSSHEHRRMNFVGRAVRSFGQFWWEFLIGDAPELFAATVVVVVLAILLRHHRDVAYVVVPLTTIVLLVASTLRAARRSRGDS